MKKIVTTILLASICLCSMAQDLQSNFVTESTAGKFEETKGSVLKKERFYTKNFNGFSSSFSISPSMITDLRTGEKIPYVIIGTAVNNRKYNSIVDFDEIPACIEAIDYIINSEVSNKPLCYVDVFIRTRDALQIGAVYDDVLLKKWQTAITHSKFVSNPTALVSVKNLQELLDELKSAKTLLEEKMK